MILVLRAIQGVSEAPNPPRGKPDQPPARRTRAKRLDRAVLKGLAPHLREPLLTCEALLAETAFHLQDSALVLRFMETGLVRLAFLIEDHRRELVETG
jgi:hypothetical protein